MVTRRRYLGGSGDGPAWRGVEYGNAHKQLRVRGQHYQRTGPPEAESHANWDAASWSRDTVVAEHYPGPPEHAHAGGRFCRCARCRVNWSLRARIYRGDLSVPSQSQLQTKHTTHTTHQPSRSGPHHHQSIHHDNFTMVGKVSERVLAREGRFFEVSWRRFCAWNDHDNDSRCAVADSSPSTQVSSAPTMA